MPIKILLVDDNENNLLSMEVALEKSEYLFFRATSGRDALRILLNEEDFSLILLDVKMPIMDGYETAELIYQRDKLKHIPIIFITAITLRNNTNPNIIVKNGVSALIEAARELSIFVSAIQNK